MATALPLETQTLYAELLEHLMGVRAQRSIGGLTGSFAEKTIKGEKYLYWQASQPGGSFIWGGVRRLSSGWCGGSRSSRRRSRRISSACIGWLALQKL
jgi:hypothetical protein